MTGTRVNLVGGNSTTLGTKDLTGYTQGDDVVIKLPGNMSLKKLIRKIDKYPPNSNGNGPDLGPIPEPPPVSGKKPTPVDMDVSSVLGADKSYCRIVVIVNDRDFRFMPDEKAITAADQAGTEMFFNLTYDGSSTVIFDCVRDDSKPKIGHFNIGLIITDRNYELPIVIDPKVQNRG